MAGASLTTPSTGPVMTAGIPKPPAPKPAKAPKPVVVKAHTRAAPTSKPSRPQSNPLLDPNQSLSGQSLLNAARQLANLQTQDPLRELQAQIAQNNAQTQGTIGQVGGFYNQLEPFVQSGVNQQGQIAAGLNQTLQGIGQNTQNTLQGAGQGALASLAKYAPDVSGSGAAGDLAAQIARQQGLAAQQAGTYQAFGANQGANYQGFGASQLGTFGLQGQEALKNIAQSGTVRNAPLAAKIAGLRAQQGALTATDLGKLRQQEVSNNIARTGLAIRQDTARTAIQNTKNEILNRNKSTSIAQQRANTTAAAQRTTARNLAFNQNPKAVGSAAWERSQRETGSQFANDPNAVGSAAWARVQAANARAGKAGASGSKPLTTNENNVANQRIDKIISAIKTWQQQGIKNAKQQVIVPHPTDAQMRQVLGSAYASPLVEAAFDLLGYGYLTSQTAKALHDMGIRDTMYQGSPARVVNRGNRSATGGAISGAGGKGNLF